MKNRRQLTEIRDQSQYFHQPQRQYLNEESAGWNNYEQSYPTNLHLISKYKRAKINKKDHQYLRNYQKYQEEQSERTRLQKLSRAVREYLGGQQQSQLKGRRLNSRQKQMWIQEMSKPKYIQRKYVKNKQRFHSERNPSDRYSVLSGRYEQDFLGKRKRQEIKKSYQVPTPKIKERISLPHVKNPIPKKKYKEINDNMIDAHDYWLYFQRACKLKTYFIIDKKTVEEPQSQKLALSLVESYLPLVKMPSENKAQQYIDSYQPQSDIKIFQLKKMKDYAVKINKKDQSLYFGQFSNGMKNGIGVFITSKALFEGTFQNNQIVEGVQKKKAGVYKGDFKKGKRQGEGYCFWSNGEEYSGQWKNNRKHGNGYWKSKNNDTYVGQWKNGKAHGYGIYKKENGQNYEGEYFEFQKHGKGIETFPNGDRYEGQYLDGEATGKGKYFWSKGVNFQGKLQKGQLRQGVFKCGKIFQYDGEFNEKGPTGMGRLKFGNGTTYHGMFRDGQMNGFGRIDNSLKGQTYEGYFIENQLVSSIKPL